ncbi:MAG: DUF4105 domain-containing protein [Bacteroidia bacterium]
MKLSALLLCGLALLGMPAVLPAQTLSPDAQVSLLTCAPGDELYSAFGHSAIRIYDPGTRLDRVYNYGTFDFSPPQFYFDFVGGKLNYRLDAETYQHFDRVYRYLMRSYTAQVLNLSHAQKEALYQFLEFNYLPENRYYLYDFFFDNCATRIRDVFTEVLGDSLQWVDFDQPGPKSMRHMLDDHLGDRPWADFGIDIILASPADRIPTHSEETFLPDNLAIEVGRASIVRNGQIEPLVIQTVPAYVSERLPSRFPWYLHPLTAGCLLLLVVGGFTAWRWQRHPARYVGDGILFMVAGLAGWVILLLWFATDHTTTVRNWNVLWLLPTHLLLGPLLFFRQRPDWLRLYFRIGAALISLLLLGWWWLPQGLNPWFVPVMLTLLLRSAVLGYRL